ncbi:MAG: shikimate dehydrogenase, partial [Hyphomicrobiales bacterium]|nr:shikimate dehydrogenase [Hyphomicrobiales bacterium]
MGQPARAACIIGWPAKQSRSPMLHGYWLRTLGVDGEYRAEERTPDEFPGFVANLARHGYVGANVTMPHKDAALALSQPDERARAAGAANTLWLGRGELRSTNTDIEGFIAALDLRAPGWDQRTSTAVVLGAGGTGRAIVYGFLERGIRTVFVVNRTRAKAEEMRDRFGSDVHAAAFEDLPRLLAGTPLLANATSLGMVGKAALTVDLSPMPEGSVIGEAVNVPLVTPLLAAARARGFQTADGLDMLLHQAVRGFELWFGVRPKVTD